MTKSKIAIIENLEQRKAEIVKLKKNTKSLKKSDNSIIYFIKYIV
jgi:hypothetical protein